MKPVRFFPSFLVTAAAAVLLLGTVRAEDNVSTIKFSDPAKPGTLKINLGRGELKIVGADTGEVSVKSDGKSPTNKPRKDGLRELSNASTFAFSEKDNVVTLDAATGGDWGGRGNSDFRVTVPRNTTVIVQNAWGGDIACTGIAGDIEITSMHGEIHLDDVAGGVVVGTMNGEIHANIRELHEGKPLSFTAIHGDVVIRVPANAKANVRLRTQNGSVLTDFDETAIVTKTESAGSFPRTKGAVTLKSNGKVLTADIQDAIREASQISATAVKEALLAVKEGLEASRMDTDEARKRIDQARSQLERARSEADRRRSTGRASSSSDDVAPAAPAAPAQPAMPVPAALPAMPKLPPMPTISGGKLVSGTLNGGGPEISVATMSGDVKLLQAEKK